MKSLTRWSRLTGLAVALSVLLGSPSVSADDLAAEAELHFEIGSDLYLKSDFRGALEHWLLSNRLAPNRNVVFNIGRAYEQLKRYPDAFFNYNRSLLGEADAAQRKRVEEAIARVSPSVAIIDATTTPPGATVYIDRKDLGARGTTPLRLGLVAGRYRVLVELPGHEPAEATVEVGLGERKPVALALEPILGALQVEAKPSSQGAAVLVDGETKPRCEAPCEVKLAPGKHALRLLRDGYEPLETTVDIEPRSTTKVSPELLLRRGTVVVRSDVRDAAVEIDGGTQGFTPSVLSLPVGKRKLLLKLPGYRTVERVIEVRPNEELKLEIRMTLAEQVSAVSRTTEAAEDAPASLSIVHASELRAMRYPTIAEALRGVRGAYVTDDRTYTFVGFRGISRTQDYGNKVPILQDGLLMNDNILVQSFAGHEGRTDLDDIERIEVVRGPGSVLYGTNAFLGVINLITRRQDRPTSGEASLTTSDYGLLRMRGSVNVRISPHASVWTSVAAGRAAGRDFHFPDYEADSGSLAGNARGLDGFDTGTVQGRATYKAFTVQWFGSRRSKLLPTAEYDSIFGSKMTFIDTHGRLEARFEPRLSDSVQSLSRAYLSTYDFNGETPYAVADGGPTTEHYRGRWFGVEQRFLANLGPARLIVGGELQRHFTVSMEGTDSSGLYLNASQPYSVLAGYGLLDAQPHKTVKLSLGGRVDNFSTFGTAINPRGAVIFRPSDDDTLKLMGGKAFRAPSAYEQFYEGPAQQPSPGLKPENIYSGEVEYSHRFSEVIAATGSVYYNQVTGLVVARGAGVPEDKLRLENSSVPVDSMGAEVELRRDFRDGWMLTAWGAFQSTSYRNASKEGLRRVPNSPAATGSLRLAFPILGTTLHGMTRLTLESFRYDRHDSEGDPPQGHNAGAVVWDLIFSGESERYRVDYNLGFYNLGDHRYDYPVSGEFRMRTITQPGRTALAHLGIRFLPRSFDPAGLSRRSSLLQPRAAGSRGRHRGSTWPRPARRHGSKIRRPLGVCPPCPGLGVAALEVAHAQRAPVASLPPTAPEVASAPPTKKAYHGAMASFSSRFFLLTSMLLACGDGGESSTGQRTTSDGGSGGLGGSSPGGAAGQAGASPAGQAGAGAGGAGQGGTGQGGAGAGGAGAGGAGQGGQVSCGQSTDCSKLPCGSPCIIVQGIPPTCGGGVQSGVCDGGGVCKPDFGQGGSGGGCVGGAAGAAGAGAAGAPSACATLVVSQEEVVVPGSEFTANRNPRLALVDGDAVALGAAFVPTESPGPVTWPIGYGKLAPWGSWPIKAPELQQFTFGGGSAFELAGGGGKLWMASVTAAEIQGEGTSIYGIEGAPPGDTVALGDQWKRLKSFSWTGAELLVVGDFGAGDGGLMQGARVAGAEVTKLGSSIGCATQGKVWAGAVALPSGTPLFMAATRNAPPVCDQLENVPPGWARKVLLMTHENGALSVVQEVGANLSITYAALLPRSDGAWLLYQFGDAEAPGALLAQRLGASGELVGAPLTALPSGILYGEPVVAALGDRFAVIWEHSLGQVPQEHVKVMGDDGASIEALLTNDFIVSGRAIGSPKGDKLLVAWESPGPSPSSSVTLKRVDCAPEAQ